MDNRTPKRNKKRRKHLQKALRKAQKRLLELGPYERYTTLRRAQNAVCDIEEQLVRMDEHLFDPGEWDDHEEDGSRDRDLNIRAARREKFEALENA